MIHRHSRCSTLSYSYSLRLCPRLGHRHRRSGCACDSHSRVNSLISASVRPSARATVINTIIVLVIVNLRVVTIATANVMGNLVGVVIAIVSAIAILVALERARATVLAVGMVRVLGMSSLAVCAVVSVAVAVFMAMRSR